MDTDNFFRIKTNNLPPRKGRVLISEPFLYEGFFGRSVVLLVEHNEEGTLGVVMNKPILCTNDDLFVEDNEHQITVGRTYLGGPVETDKMFFMHPYNDIPGRLKVKNGLYFGGNSTVFNEKVMRGEINLDHVRFFVGYSGWGKGQLDSELRRNSWLVSETSVEELLRINAGGMWKRYVRHMGTSYKNWLYLPEDPSLN
ncbi:MAG: YqgE/AlgH family protein [Lentimicrobiaceae bacterium]|jgi:putative transcriptional regulator|nr:YqgE/AlgH family protein [Lentimicrobiaceae bacterium]